MIYGNLEEYPISGIFAVAERVACSTRTGVGPPIGTVLRLGGRPRDPFVRRRADSTRERTQAGAAATRSS